MRHDGLGAPAEQGDEVVDQPALRDVAGNRRFENMEVAHLLDPAYRLFGFQAIDDSLDRGVSRAPFLGERLLNLANRRLTTGPQGVHDLEFESGQFRLRHRISYERMHYYYKCRRNARIF